MTKRISLLAVTLALVAATGLAGCSSNANTSSSSSGAGTGKIAMLLPCDTCASWPESIAHPGIIADVKKLDPNIDVLYSNAQGAEEKMVSQAESAIAQGATVLIIETLNPATGIAIAAKAKAAHVSVISFDGLTSGPNVDFYVSFDNALVGSAQGKYLADHLPKGSPVAIVNGLDQGIGDVFKKGVHSAIDPAVSSGALKLAFEADTDWDPTTGQQKMTQGLTATDDKIAGVVATNDGLAGGVVAALQARSLAGKVLVTGQDATIAGLQRILTGTQSMTVFKDIAQEVKVAAKVAVGLVHGDKKAISSVATTTVNNGSINVPAAILSPVVVTKGNVQVVVDAGVYTWDEICKGLSATDCTHS